MGSPTGLNGLCSATTPGPHGARRAPRSPTNSPTTVPLRLPPAWPAPWHIPGPNPCLGQPGCGWPAATGLSEPLTAVAQPPASRTGNSPAAGGWAPGQPPRPTCQQAWCGGGPAGRGEPREPGVSYGTFHQLTRQGDISDLPLPGQLLLCLSPSLNRPNSRARPRHQVVHPPAPP